MKKLTTLLLSVFMTFGIITTASANTENFNILAFRYYDDNASFVEYCAYRLGCENSDLKVVNNVIYKLSENGEYYSVEYLFDKVGTANYATEVNVVDYINDIPVTVVNDCLKLRRNEQYYYGQNLKKIILPNTITKIGREAFAYLPNLEEINLPDSIEVIKTGAFLENRNLKTINIPKNLKANQHGAFVRMYGLETIVIPKSMKEIPESFFASCNKLKKVTFESDCSIIGSNAFSECKSLKTIKLPISLTAIHISSFYRSGLEEITIPTNCKTIGKGAFNECNNLKKVVLKGKNKRVFWDSFGNCKKLEKVVGSKNISEYRVRAFENSKALKTFTIGENIKRIENNIFMNCKNLKKVKILTKSTNVFNWKKTFDNMPKTCTLYVKTQAMKKVVLNCGFKGKVIVDKKLK